MKQLFFSLCLMFSICTASFAATNTEISINKSVEKEFNWKKFHIQGTITLSGGCVITYDLWVDIGLMPFGYNGVTGSLTMSGQCGGTQNINARASVDENKKITNFEIISSSSKLQTVLKSKEFTAEMIKKLDQQNFFAQESSN